MMQPAENANPFAPDPVLRRRVVADRVLRWLPVLATGIVLVPLAIVMAYVVREGMAAISWEFLTSLPGAVTERGGGVGNGIVGTLIVVLVASLMAVPVGILAGIYLAEFGDGHLGALLRFLTEVLSGVPSIVVGLFIYGLVVIRTGTFSALAGSMALAVIMLPLVTRTTEEMLRLVPGAVREAGLALGISPWKVTLRIVLPAAAGGVLTGVMLAVARIAGETAPLLFTALNNNFWSWRLDQPIATLSVQVFTFALTPFENAQQKAWGGAFILIMLVLVLNVVARTLVARRQGGGAS